MLLLSNGSHKMKKVSLEYKNIVFWIKINGQKRNICSLFFLFRVENIFILNIYSILTVTYVSILLYT